MGKGGEKGGEWSARRVAAKRGSERSKEGWFKALCMKKAWRKMEASEDAKRAVTFNDFSPTFTFSQRVFT